MGKTSKWLRNFFAGKKSKEKIRDSNPDSSMPVTSIKEKRWSFRRSIGATKDWNFTETSFGLLDSEIDEKRHVMYVENYGTVRAIEEASAIKIQSFFRSYLARKALNALKGLVKMQALVRGHLIRKQAKVTLRCMQALVKAQDRARAERIRIVGASLRQHNYRRSPHHTFEKDCYEEEYARIVEIDLGGRRYSLGETEIRTDLPPQFSPIPLSIAAHTSFEHPLYPNYMANTESSKAKLRSQSAPKQRIDAYERQSSKRRELVEGRNIPREIRMQRSSSLVGLVGNSSQYPWSIKLDKSDMSIIESECGSTSTLMTNKNYCKSPAGYELTLMLKHNVLRIAGRYFEHWDASFVELEAFSFLDGLIQEWMFSKEGLIIEGDNLNVIHFLQQCLRLRRWKDSPRLAFSFEMLIRFHGLLFSHTLRENNRAVDFCAREAVRLGSSFCFDGLPSSQTELHVLIVADLTGGIPA